MAVAEWGLMLTGDPAGELPMALEEVGDSEGRQSLKGKPTGLQVTLSFLRLVFYFIFSARPVLFSQHHSLNFVQSN